MKAEGKYAVFIGLEIHIHLKTKSKMFCSCPARYGDPPNSNVCPICLAYPGTLPQLNRLAMDLGYLVAQTLNCTLPTQSIFVRKNYFYPDMPKNYQISQYADPIGKNGWIETELEGSRLRTIRIHDVHLEEDAGKMIHAGDVTFLDFNRAGYPLLEIVTEPDLSSGEETEAFLRDFQRLIRYLEVSDGNMDEGSMKCDANISINQHGKGLGKKVEIKNMNSPRFVRLAMKHEIERQTALLDAGKAVVQETRLWNENRDISESMRRKEEADDYRYFSEPDLPPFIPDENFLSRINKALVELPLVRKKRLMADYNLSVDQAEFLHNEKKDADFFEETVSLGSSSKKVVAWLSSDIRKILNRENLLLQDSPLSPLRLAELLSLIDKNVISGKIAKKVLDKIFDEDLNPQTIIEREGWAQIIDPKILRSLWEKIFLENPVVIAAVLNGDQKQKSWLLGQLMQATEGKAAPDLAHRLLEEKLNTKENPPSI